MTQLAGSDSAQIGAHPTLAIGPPIQASFIRRLNRFAVAVELDGRQVEAHLPNSGRMAELLVPGCTAILAGRASAHRRTDYDMVMVEHEGHWVSVDARVPSRLLALALAERAIPPLAEYSHVLPEKRFLGSRFDFLLEEGDKRCLVEAKSVNLVRDGAALFPDAPTTRGARQLRELAQARQSGYEAAVIFVIQRSDATGLAPYDGADPDFGSALREAIQAGVGVHAYTCRVTPEAIALASSVPVII